MLRRQMTLTRLELDEYRASFAGLLKRVAESEQSGDWPAVVSDEACGICPASYECPIPREVRGNRGTILDVEQAADTALIVDRIDAERKAMLKAVKAFCKEHDVALRFGNKVFEFVPQTSVRVDREAMEEAWQLHVEHREPFDPARFRREVTSTTFRARDLKPDELEGSNDRAA